MAEEFCAAPGTRLDQVFHLGVRPHVEVDVLLVLLGERGDTLDEVLQEALYQLGLGLGIGIVFATSLSRLDSYQWISAGVTSIAGVRVFLHDFWAWLPVTVFVLAERGVQLAVALGDMGC